MSRRRQKKRRQRVEAPRSKRGGIGLRWAAAVLVAVALAGGLVAAALVSSGVLGGGGAGPKTAAIVDQLSLTQPNRDFAAKAGDLLRYAGYNVDYYPGEQVTVDFYRTLPLRDYDVLILRVHSGIVREIRASTGEETRTEYVSLFSGEPYDETKYLDDRYPQVQVDRVSRATYYEGAPPLFGISPEFVKHSMRGRFDKTLVILMGCDGLRSTRAAEAFVEKGAGAFVSWSKAVSASHTDAATLRLLQHLVVDGLTLGEAVAQTSAELGPDPGYGAELRVYPPEE
jgi:hypothetical protein